MASSLVQFSNSKPLGQNGLKWLKLHLVNKFGSLKTSPTEDRLQFADSVLDLAIDSAQDPFQGHRWWLKSPNPWQTLAACFEIKAVLESPNPELFESKLPIGQDGSANGIQHFAAMARDQFAGPLVNLTPNIKPVDVYEEIAKMLEQKRLEQTEFGINVAKMSEGIFNRSLAKKATIGVLYHLAQHKMSYKKMLNSVSQKEVDDKIFKYIIQQTESVARDNMPYCFKLKVNIRIEFSFNCNRLQPTLILKMLLKILSI